MSRPSSARVSSERCGWLLASSGLIRPSSTSICTYVSSLVIWANSPWRSMYARESPMCTMPILLPEKSTAVSVVPMPSNCGLASTVSRSCWFATPTACRSASTRASPGTSSSRGAMAAMTMLLATSPAAMPPMPSATASSRGPA